MDHPKTLSAALCRIYTEVGVAVLKNPDNLPAVFLDIAPNLKAERNQIELLANSGCMKTLSAADTLSPAEVKALVATCVDSLCNYYSMDRQKAEELCNTYVKALNGVAYVPDTGKSTEHNGNGGKSGGSVSGGSGGGKNTGIPTSGGGNGGGRSGSGVKSGGTPIPQKPQTKSGSGIAHIAKKLGLALIWLFFMLPGAICLAAYGLLFYMTILLIPLGKKCFRAAHMLLFIFSKSYSTKST